MTKNRQELNIQHSPPKPEGVWHSKTHLQYKEVQSAKITIISQQIKLRGTKEFLEVTLIRLGHH